MSDEERKRFEVLLEQVLHQISLIAKGHSMLSTKIDGVQEDLSRRMDLLDAKIGMVHDKLDAKIDRVQEDLSGRMDMLDAKIDAVHDDLKSEVQAVAKTVESHAKRLDTLERKAG